jgi:DUF2948 family protein
MSELKLIALDADDLAVISANLQDAVMRVGDLAFQPREKRFAAVANRFDWVDALEQEAAKGEHRHYARRRTALRFERVLSAQVQGLDPKNKSAVTSLLAVAFEPLEPPAGLITLQFADGSAIRLHVECIEAELRDLGPAWEAKSKPQHPEDTPRR